MSKQLSSGVTIGVVLASESECTPATGAQLANILVDAAELHHTKRISDIIAATEALMAPPPLPDLLDFFDVPEQDDDSRILEDDDDFDEWNAVDQMPPSELISDKYTLEFNDLAAEAAFTALHNNALAKLDMGGFLICICSLVYIFYIPGTKFDKLERGEGVQKWRGFLFFLPLLLFLTERGRVIYCRYREMFVVYTIFMSAMWHIHVKHYMHCLRVDDYIHPAYMHGYLWLSVGIVLFQMRFRLLLPITIACFAVSAKLMPTICSTFYPERPGLFCVGYELSKVVVFVLVGPLTVARLLEKLCRKSFMETYGRT